jgi:uncharacterized protein (DUF362 family)
MLERALIELCGRPTASEALAELVPAIADPAQRYGIKVNSVNRHLPSHPCVVFAVAELLVTAGARAENIIVFDRSDGELVTCGFAVNLGSGVQVCGTNHDGVGYMDSSMSLTDGSVRLSRIIEERIDHLINIPVLKNHEMAGVTLALKNHFGSIDQPAFLHARDRSCCPGIAELNAVPAIRDRTRLVIIDALFASCAAGLAGPPDSAPMALIASRDPVAADSIGLQTINNERSARGLAGIDARHIGEAAARGLGSAAPHTTEHTRVVLNVPRPFVGPSARQASGCAAAQPKAALAAAAGLWAKRRGR